MFKPEYIMDDVVAFGVEDTIALISKKLQRMGKTARMARMIARELVINTVFVSEFRT